jgi:hypothetical protein
VTHLQSARLAVGARSSLSAAAAVGGVSAAKPSAPEDSNDAPTNTMAAGMLLSRLTPIVQDGDAITSSASGSSLSLASPHCSCCQGGSPGAAAASVSSPLPSVACDSGTSTLPAQEVSAFACCSQHGYLSSRGGCHKRWRSLVNCDHGDSTTNRWDSPALARPAAADVHATRPPAAAERHRRGRHRCCHPRPRRVPAPPASPPPPAALR